MNESYHATSAVPQILKEAVLKLKKMLMSFCQG